MPDVIHHEEAALNRLAQYLREKPRTEGLIRLVGQRADGTEAGLQQLQTARALSTAVGAQLDVIGDIVGQPRLGFGDAEYRLHLAARIRLNRSSGTAPEIIAVLRLVVPEGASVKLEEYDPATILVRIGLLPLTPELAAYVLDFLRLSKAAGVRASLHWFESPLENVFRFDSGPGWDQGHFAGAAVA